VTDPAVSARRRLIDSRCRVTLQDCVSEWRSGAGVAGVSAAVRVNGQLHWTSADTRSGVLAADALCPIYSITKTLTAMCALRLAERGALGLSDPVAAWCPDVGLRDEVTIAHLLRHTSGLGDYGPLPEYHDAVRSHPSDPWTRRQFLDAVLPRGMRFEPGGGWAYSNIGYMLLREVLQRAAGRTFADTIHDLVAAPLALQHTRVVDTIDGWSACVPGYGPEVDVNGQIVDVRRVYHPGWCAPGVAVSTAEEVTLVFDALLAGQILEPGSLAEMLTLVPLSADPDERHAYGMGIGSEIASPRGANYGHGGGGPGYDLDATIFPDTRFGRVAIAVFVCSSGGQRWSQACEEQLLSCAFA
jgi:D-alanyl-D-alanine carboxypeptidase